MSPAGRSVLSTFAVTSLLAVGAGCLVIALAGAGPGVWIRNVAAWAIGAVLAQIVARIRPSRLFGAVLLLTPLALLISLLNSGLSGVHRWISLGPLHWNVAFLLLPAAIVAFAALSHAESRWMWWAALVIALELCLQPDASQATAFTVAMIVTLVVTPSRGQIRVTASLLLVLAAGIAWTRPDPLKPVPEVEGIIGLARTFSVAIDSLCVTTLLAVSASPLLALRDADRRWPIALSAYFFGCTCMPLFGTFPVPLVGMGMSPIIGFWIGIGALTAACDSVAVPPAHVEQRSS